MAADTGSSYRSATRGGYQQEGFRLTLLGGASLEGPAGTVSGRAVQRRRMALLALLAVARQRGVSRDKLVFYLWPDNEPERARHLLSDSLYTLHKALGADSVLSTGDQLRLNDRVVHSDVAAFEDALEQRDWEAAVELYRREFLKGTYLCSNPEWERWLDHERGRYAQAFGKALEAAARERGARGDLAGAVELWRRAAVHDPTDSRIAISVMLALETAGNCTAAIQHAKIHEAMVREELDVPIPPEVHALVERLRSATRAPAPPAPPPAEPAPPPPVDAPPEIAEPEAARHPPAVPANPAMRPRRGSPALLLVPMLLLVLAGVWLAGRTRSAPEQTTATSTLSVAVFPFSVRGADTLTYLGEGMVDLLSAKLDGLGEIRAVDPRAVLGLTREQQMDALDPQRAQSLAQQLGATHYVLGNILELGGRLQLSASLYDRTGARQATAELAVQNELQLFELVDRMTAQLVAAQSRGPTAELTRLAALTTTSLPALKAYLEGERAFRRHQYAAAREAFRRAIVADSTFALAAYRLSTVSDWVDDFTTQDVAGESVRQAARFSARLPPTDRMLVDGMLAFLSDAPDEALRIYRNLTMQQPSNVEAWYRLGEVQYHDNPLLGLSPEQSRAAFQRVLSLDPEHQPARARLATLATRAGDRGALDTIIPRLLAAAPEDSLRWLHLRAFAVDDTAAQARFAALYPTLSDSLLWALVEDVVGGTTNFQGAQRIARHLTEPSRSPKLRIGGHLLLGWLEIVRGRPSAAKRQIAAVARLDPAAALEYRAVFAIPYFLPVPDTELRMIRDSVAAWQGTGVENPYLKLYTDMWPSIRQYLLALLGARLRDEEGVQQHLATIEPQESTPERLRVIAQRKVAVRARVAALRGDPATALALLEQRHFPGVPAERFPAINYFERHLRPGLLQALGRQQEALRWYGAAPWTGEAYLEETLWDLVHLAPFHLERAKILDRLGHEREAAKHYARFVELWKDADPELQPQVVEARRRLARLRRSQPVDGGNVGVEGGWVPRGKVPSRSERAGEMLGRAAGENECCGMGSSSLQ